MWLLSPSPAQMWMSASLLLLSSAQVAVSTVKVPLSAPVPPGTCWWRTGQPAQVGEVTVCERAPTSTYSVRPSKTLYQWCLLPNTLAHCWCFPNNSDTICTYSIRMHACVHVQIGHDCNKSSDSSDCTYVHEKCSTVVSIAQCMCNTYWCTLRSSPYCSTSVHHQLPPWFHPSWPSLVPRPSTSN